MSEPVVTREAPTRSAVRVVTVSQFAECSGLGPTEAREFIEGFAERGVVERAVGGWRFTPAGLEIARDFRWWGTDE